MRPLEVVQQRPHEVAAHVDAGGDRAAYGGDVAVEVGDPVGVADPPVRVDLVGVRRAVLGDHQR